MTVGHITEQERPGDNQCKPGETDENSHFPDEEEFELDFEETDLIKLSPYAEQPTQPSVSWSKIGRIFNLPSNTEEDQLNLDWALAEFDDQSYYRPNLLVFTDSDLQRCVPWELDAFPDTQIEVAASPVFY
jgi:hypothetical protein